MYIKEINANGKLIESTHKYMYTHTTQWRMQDFLKEGSGIQLHVKFLKPRPLLIKLRPFSIVFERNYLPYQSNRSVFVRTFC